MVAPHRGAAIELAVLVAANAAATLVRFLFLRVAIQDSRRFQERAATSLATLTTSERILR
jgi:hypothetical protein